MNYIKEIDSNYYWFDVVGDGHCFLNCILEIFSKEYRELTKKYQSMELINKRKQFLRKFRCDIANTLMSESDKPMSEIHSRLAFLNPTTMSGYFYIKDQYDTDGSPKSSYGELELVSELYKTDGKSITDELYKYLAGILIFRNGDIVTKDKLKELYESDFRLHEIKIMELKENLSESLNPADFGVGVYSPTLKFYELCKNITGYDDDVESIIKNLLNDDAFIEYRTSVIIANLLNINIIYFSIGGNYTSYDEILCDDINAKYIFMINHNNIHWDLIGYKHDSGLVFTFVKPTENLKKILFDVLNMKYKSGFFLK